MKMEERRKQIVELVNREGNVSFGRLKAEFDPVSEMTLRRDLEALDKAGSIIRVHGGVKSVEVVIGTDDLLLKRSVRNMKPRRSSHRRRWGFCASIRRFFWTPAPRRPCWPSEFRTIII